uniref:type II toxin-antitoxin system RelE/ParE family toxin n=1 Tax=Pseudomonas sp. TMP25 TaxID=3136561 RepID=UPI0040481B8C
MPLADARVAAELLFRIENFYLFPEIGRTVEFAPTPKVIRDAVFGKYIIRCSADTETVVILHIWHHNEDHTQSI